MLLHDFLSSSVFPARASADLDRCFSATALALARVAALLLLSLALLLLLLHDLRQLHELGGQQTIDDPFSIFLKLKL